MSAPLWFLVLGTFMSILTVAGNGIVIYLIVSRQRLHNPTNWIILSLAVADFSLGACYVLTLSLLDTNNLEYSIVSFLSATSALNLCLLTLDRYIFITKPLEYVTLMTTKRAVLLIFTAWIASFLPHFVFYVKVSTVPSPEEHNDLKIFANVDFAVFEILPMVVVSFAAARIFCIVRRHRQIMKTRMAQIRFNQGTEFCGEVSTAHNERTSSMEVICVAVTVFLICYILELFCTVYDLQIAGKLQSTFCWDLSNLFYVVNSSINPVAYALFKNDIRKCLRSMFHCNERTPSLD